MTYAIYNYILYICCYMHMFFKRTSGKKNDSSSYLGRKKLERERNKKGRLAVLFIFHFILSCETEFLTKCL